MIKRFSSLIYFAASVGLTVLALAALNKVVNSWFPFAANNELLNATANETIQSADILASIQYDMLFVFLGLIILLIVGLTLFFLYNINRRFLYNEVPWFVPMRQSVMLGFAVAFCTYLQMERAFTPLVGIMALVVVVMIELLIQTRTSMSKIF